VEIYGQLNPPPPRRPYSGGATRPVALARVLCHHGPRPYGGAGRPCRPRRGAVPCRLSSVTWERVLIDNAAAAARDGPVLAFGRACRRAGPCLGRRQLPHRGGRVVMCGSGVLSVGVDQSGCWCVCWCVLFGVSVSRCVSRCVGRCVGRSIDVSVSVCRSIGRLFYSYHSPNPHTHAHTHTHSTCVRGATHARTHTRTRSHTAGLSPSRAHVRSYPRCCWPVARRRPPCACSTAPAPSFPPTSTRCWPWRPTRPTRPSCPSCHGRCGHRAATWRGTNGRGRL
jgi:hypothetical protein